MLSENYGNFLQIRKENAAHGIPQLTGLQSSRVIKIVFFEKRDCNNRGLGHWLGTLLWNRESEDISAYLCYPHFWNSSVPTVTKKVLKSTKNKQINK